MSVADLNALNKPSSLSINVESRASDGLAEPTEGSSKHQA